MTQRYRVLVNGETLNFNGVPITLELVPEEEVGVHENAGGTEMSETTVKCPKCGFSGIVITELLDGDLRLISESQAAEIERLRAALKQYADHENWDSGDDDQYMDRWLGCRSGSAWNGWTIAEEALK